MISSIYFDIIYRHAIIHSKNIVGRMWCHCREVYLPMSYIYGKRFVGHMTPLVLELRNELYEEPYNLIDWNKARNQCAKVCWRNYILVLKY